MIGARTAGALLAAALAGCAAPDGPMPAPEDAAVRLAVVNEGTEPLRCTILFGHWVEQDAGTVAPDAMLELTLRRQARDGALYVARRDGRKMMAENLICGPLEQWWERRADVSLLPLRAGPAQRFAASCRVADRARCTSPAPMP